jgi:hypothetical protein
MRHRIAYLFTDLSQHYKLAKILYIQFVVAFDTFLYNFAKISKK